MMLSTTAFLHFIESNQLFRKQDKLMLAVSGGIDSVVLCHLCKTAGFDLTLLHCNFNLRGEESLRDEQFTRDLANKMEVPILVKSFDTTGIASLEKLSIQETARKLRYQWFSELAIEKTNDDIKKYILTAHHRDDNVETVLMNFFRGTGLNGLTGIPLKNGHIVRPLLPFSREEINGYARLNDIHYVEDSSNSSDKYTRNFLRNNVIPLLEKNFPTIKSNIASAIDRFKGFSILHEQMLNRLLDKMVRSVGEEIHVPVIALMKQKHTSLIYELMSRYGFGEQQLPELYKLAEAQSGRYFISSDGTHRILRHRRWFIIAPIDAKEATTYIATKDDHEINLGKTILQIGQKYIKDFDPGKDPALQQLDMKDITFPLLIRKWKAGDYFYPLGLKKKKKIARFFIDLKLSRTEKEEAWVVESAGRIICVPGYRIDDRFRITDHTNKILELAIKRQHLL